MRHRHLNIGIIIADVGAAAGEREGSPTVVVVRCDGIQM